MRTYLFTLLLDGVGVKLDALEEVGCVNSVCGDGGVWHVGFEREGGSFEEAVDSAVRDAESTGVTVLARPPTRACARCGAPPEPRNTAVKVYRFSLLLAFDGGDVEGRLVELRDAVCGDATFGLSSGRSWHADFEREARSLYEAVETATREVQLVEGVRIVMRSRGHSARGG